MGAMLESRTIGVSIQKEWRAVYEFARRPENFARWASGAAGSLRREGDDWVADGPDGRAILRFAERNDLGVLDHWVILASGVEIYMPVRAVPNGSGCEVTVTLFRQPGMSDDVFARRRLGGQGSGRPEGAARNLTVHRRESCHGKLGE